VVHQSRLDGTLTGFITNTKEIEEIGILERFASEIRAGKRQAEIEVGGGLPFPLQQPSFDVVHQHGTRPPHLRRPGGIGQPQVGCLELAERHQIVPPGQLSNSLLDNLRIRPRLRKGAHVEQVDPGEALHLGKGITQIHREALDHLGSPALAPLALEDVAADLPVEQHQLAADAAGRPLLRLVDAGFQLCEPGAVIRRERDDVGHGRDFTTGRSTRSIATSCSVIQA
jgi:hypothetical protein